MASGAQQIQKTYPIASYRYRLVVGDNQMAFNSVSGLEMSAETIEYKDGTGGCFPHAWPG